MEQENEGKKVRPDCPCLGRLTENRWTRLFTSHIRRDGDTLLLVTCYLLSFVSTVQTVQTLNIS